MTDKKYFLQHFHWAQEHDYEKALAEVKAGRKQSHWIWYIFPQMKGLGHSQKSWYYGIDGRDEAKAYMDDPVLHHRLVEITQAVVDSDRTVQEIFGGDFIKVRSCILLFNSVSDEPVFRKLIAKNHW